MMLNVSVEWVMVNFNIPIEHNIAIWSLMAVTLVIIIASIILRFKEDERDSDRDAA